MKKIYLLIIILYLPDVFAQTDFRFFVNNINLPMDNRGILGDIYQFPGGQGGKYDDIIFLYSSGFFLSGKEGDSTWANAMATSVRIEDYLAGKVGSDPLDPLNRVYSIYSVDPPFGTSWQNWRDAVTLGALFYDGDNDGVYNPIDLNGNGIWDLNEDRPDLLGDLTAWCVYNDGEESSLRLFNNISPKGIEIHQTLFAQGLNVTGPIRDIIFIRYRIINTGTFSSGYDSVYFSGWADPDLGFAFDDLTGADTLNNSGYAYNSGADDDFGINPPAFFTRVIQGPISYIPGETFIDINSNGLFDPGIDTPIDSAYNNKGLFLGGEVLPGAKNLGMTSFVHFISSDPDIGTPETTAAARNYMQGKNKIGINYDPCTFWYGQVLGGVDCAAINPIYMYSGDPVTQYGWINALPSDQRIMTNTGPFKLKENEPVDIWIAYVVGRGTDSLNSITKARGISIFANNFYKTNFTNIAVGVEDDNPLAIVDEFKLYQNYPNPFNPSTTISFVIPNEVRNLKDFSSQAPRNDNAIVTLKVYDVLGREITTLVNEEKLAGQYKVEFNSGSSIKNPASGVYYYQLRAGDYVETKKMILLK